MERETEVFNSKIVETYEKKTSEIDLKRYKESNDFSLRQETIRNRVLSILKTDIKSRKDDMWLCLLYWIKCGHIKLVIPLEEFHKINKPESISRARRKLIEDAKKGDKSLHFLLNDTETLDLREEERVNYQEYYGKKEVSKLQ
jgi:hypothetical protein